MNTLEPLEVTIESRSALCRAYMAFVRNGGVFVPTHRRYQLGDDVNVIVTLFDSSGPVAVNGTVVWVTPNRAQGKRLAGVGVQFNADDGIRARVEGLLEGVSGGDEPTHTL